MELSMELFAEICRRHGTDTAGGFEALQIARDWSQRGCPEESAVAFEDICSRYGTDPAGVNSALRLAWALLQNGSPEESDVACEQGPGEASAHRKATHWICSKITAYFDSSLGKNNIYTYAEEIGELPDRERARIYKGITDQCIAYYDECMKKDDDSCLLVTTTIMVDLYRTMNRATRFNWRQQEYLESTAAALFAHMRRDGVVVHFFTDNFFENLETVLMLFPAFLKTCGFECVDAYSAAAYLADYKYHIKETNDIYRAVPDILRTEQQMIERMLNERVGDLTDERKNYVLIAPFPHGAALKNFEKSIETPGVITLYKREEAESGKITQFPFKRS